MRKKIITVLSATIMIISISISVYASENYYGGYLTHKSPDGYNSEYTQYYLDKNYKYHKDVWAFSENEQVWKYVDSNGAIASSAGISKDGYLYNSNGVYVDMTDGSRKFLTKDAYSQLQTGMSFDQVKSILGEPHEYDDKMSTTYMIRQDEHHIDYYYYYTNNPKNYADICISDGELQNFWAYWDNK